MKKVFKVIGISILIMITLLLVIPFAFQSQIKDLVKNTLNDNLNAQVEFSDINLSLLRSFPKAHVRIDDLVITNIAPFSDEVFTKVKTIALTMSINELFKNTDEEPMIINAIAVDQAQLTLKTDLQGNQNFDIAKPNENASTETASESGNFSFDIENYIITNSSLTYIDEASKALINIFNLNHEGKGTFSASVSELDTNTEANINMVIDSTQYLTNNTLKLNALIGLDLKNNSYTFKENKGYINQLPLEFQGYLKILEDAQEVDITFKNPESSFKDFLAIIPEEFSKNIETVETTGDFKVNGHIKGRISETTIPNLDIHIASNNASFKYPDLPKRVEQISINTSIKNTTGNIDDTYIDINTLNFKIDQDAFNASATLKNITKNILVDATINGVLNLGHINQVYPIELKNELSGILKGDITTSFDMNAIETNAFERIKNYGKMEVRDFLFSSEDIVNPIHIYEADLNLNPKTVSLTNFKANTGDSDLNATGSIHNLLGFLLSDNTLQGNFDLTSNTFKVSDFMVENDTTSINNKTTPETESLKIPAFLDCTIHAQVNTVHYDNLQLKDVKGTVLIKDEQAILKNLKSNVFDGDLAISGLVSTKSETPEFNMDLGVSNFDISKSFNSLELFQGLAPIAKALQGKLNTTLSLKGNLDQDFSPQLNSLSGDALAELLTSTINPLNSKVLNELGSSLNFIDFNKLDLKDLKTAFSFNNGNVSVKPFHIKYDDINIEVSGTHSFDKTMNYNAVFQVPAKYLGNEVTQLIEKINDPSAKNMTIPITANITGSYTTPSVKTDLTSAVNNLSKQLIEIEKQKLLNQGKDKVEDLLGGLFKNKTIKPDSTKTKSKNGIKNILGGLLGSKKKKKDSIKH